MRDKHEGATALPANDSKMPQSQGATPEREASLEIPTSKMPWSNGGTPMTNDPMGAPPDSKMPRRM